MIHLVLYQPVIPPNTGNIIRLCANTGAQLHLIHPLGFELDDTKLLRAGLDYHEWARVNEYNSLESFQEKTNPSRIFTISTRGEKIYSEVKFSDNIALVFGPEDRGLPDSILSYYGRENILRIPMKSTNRSLNLSNAVAIVLYEVLRQMNFTLVD